MSEAFDHYIRCDLKGLDTGYTVLNKHIKSFWEKNNSHAITVFRIMYVNEDNTTRYVSGIAGYDYIANDITHMSLWWEGDQKTFYIVGMEYLDKVVIPLALQETKETREEVKGDA